MSNCDILFKDLKKISQSEIKNDKEFILEYLNSFKGDNIFEKFKNILIVWNQDVSQTISLNFDEKPTKLSLSYLISEVNRDLGKEIKIKDENFEIVLDIPKSFCTIVQETLPIYSLIQYIKISGISINLLDLSVQDRMNIIDNLPAKLYNTILKELSTNKTKIVDFDNKSLSNFKFNFLTNEPFLFLKGLFTNFGEEYFKDVIFHLSKRIDGNILMNSTPMEIEYYIQKYSEEMKSQNDGLTL